MLCRRSGANDATLRALAVEVDGAASVIGLLLSIASRMRARMMSTPSRSPWRMPDSSWLTPPIARTGTRAVDREAHVVDHLARR